MSFEAVRIYTQKKLLLIGLLGFYSGLPLALTGATLSAWLFEHEIDRTTIGLFAAVATPYALKFLWAPILDGVRLPVLSALGRRKSWLLLIQGLLAAAICWMGFTDPSVNAGLTALAAVAIATLSATQDIVIDGYRVERLAPEEQGQGAAMSTLGYRIGMLVSGAGALALADAHGWHLTYMFMAALMAAGLLFTLLAREPEVTLKEESGGPLLLRVHRFITGSVVAPFADFMTRPHWLTVLIFIVLYKLGDAFMGTMFNPFLLDLGFTKTDIAQIVKIYGLAATLIGTFVGGWLVTKIGTFRTLFITGFVHMFTNLMLVVQAELGANHAFLIASITLENLSGGMGLAAFVAYLSALCRVNYTATQYALLSALAAFGRTWLSTPSGWVADQLGWAGFFTFASLLALPGLAVLLYLQRKTSLKTVG